MKIRPPNDRCAFTLLDGVVVVAILALLVLIVVPLFGRAKTRSRINCVNNVKQMGIAFIIWRGDNNDKYPMDVPLALGGAKELIATGNVTGCFLLISNELSTSKILTCPQQSRQQPATNFDSLKPSNISYFLSLTATNPNSPMVLSGDANLVQNDRSVPAGILNLCSNTVTWTRDRHRGFGNLLLPDGSVPTVLQIGFAASPGIGFATNRVVIP